MDKLFLLACLTALSACSAQTGSPPEGGGSTTQDSTVTTAAPAPSMAATGSGAAAILARLPDAEGGDGSAQSGTLMVKNGCLVLETGTVTYLIGVTNRAISWNGAALRSADGAAFRLGDRIMLGGALATAGLPWTGPVPAACLAERVYVTHAITAAPKS